MGMLGSMWPDVMKKEMVLCQGGSFRVPFQFDGEGEKLRYFFVLNHDPKSDDYLWIVTATSQVQKHGGKPGVILVDKADHDDFTEKQSAICLSSLMKVDKQQLNTWIADARFRLGERLQGKALAAVLSEVAKSRLVTPAARRAILPPSAGTYVPQQSPSASSSQPPAPSV